jgi:hypothetical protein
LGGPGKNSQDQQSNIFARPFHSAASSKEKVQLDFSQQAAFILICAEKINFPSGDSLIGHQAALCIPVPANGLNISQLSLMTWIYIQPLVVTE